MGSDKRIRGAEIDVVATNQKEVVVRVVCPPSGVTEVYLDGKPLFETDTTNLDALIRALGYVKVPS